MNYNEWNIVEKQFNIEENSNAETIFSVGNGYIGMRGNLEEGFFGPAGKGLEGTYINGFYDSEYIKYGETAYGFADKSQTMLNVTSSKVIKLYIDDEEFNLLSGTVKEYERVLDLKEGVLRRSILWQTPKGREVRIEIKRIASFTNKHIAAFEYKVTPINFSGTIRLLSALNGDVTNLTTGDDPRVGAGFTGRVLSVKESTLDGTYGAIVQETKMTKMAVACAMENSLKTLSEYSVSNITQESFLGVVFDIKAKASQEIVLSKYAAYTTSRDYEEDKLSELARSIVMAAKEKGFKSIEEDQSSFLEDFWYRTDVRIKGDAPLQQGIRFNMFHLLQSSGRDGKTNIAAKGLTGEGYEGHYFWDTETYILPFFLYNNPEISRKLLEYRYSILDKARERARIMSHDRGALYPWRTINGEECSAYFPAGTAQYHINADIALAIKRYMEVSEDIDFLVQFGAEILFETARLWLDLGDYIEDKDNKFCINDVTGPDEYTAIVNNNFYTNMMAAENMRYAQEIALYLKNERPEEYTRIASKIGLEQWESEEWLRAADNMYVPYNERLRIHAQDDSFLSKAVWDFENTPQEKYPLLLNFHPLVIYRYQVCKQADVVLALLLLSHKFDLEQKRRDYDYYEKVTTHDSSLSMCIHSIAASELGYYEKAYDYFIKTARMDLDDHHGNTKHGIHAANMAGTYMCVVNGFAGMRVYEDTVSFNPYLPEGWEEYSFNILYRKRLINITVTKDKTAYKLLEGKTMEITHKGRKVLLQQGSLQEIM